MAAPTTTVRNPAHPPSRNARAGSRNDFAAGLENRLPACDGKWASSLFRASGRPMKRGGAEHAEEDAKEKEAEDRLPACDGKQASSL
jgi:hypothetical protein